MRQSQRSSWRSATLRAIECVADSLVSVRTDNLYSLNRDS